MSGGNSGGGGGGGGIRASPTISCDTLIFRTPLNSPVPAVVRSLHVGDRLDVVALSPSGPAVVRDSGGNDAGSITSTQLLDLLACIAQGFRYSAVVFAISGGTVQVEIRPEAVP